MQQESLYLHDGEHQLHLRHIWNNVKGIPVLMLHGTIENGKIFYTESGKGLACYLAEQGFDVYVADFRGKGQSKPAIKNKQNHGQHEMITRDIPKFIDFITERSQQKLHVVCHSWGGIVLASCLVRFPECLSQVASNVCFGTKRRVLVKGMNKFLKVDLVWKTLAPYLAKRRGYLDAKRLKLGADSETLSFIEQSVAWVKPGIWRDPIDGFDYQAASKNITWPATWHITGVKDKVLGHAHDVQAFIAESYNKQAKFSLLAKNSGNAVDYDHIDILTHPQALNDHFPSVVQWVTQHSAAYDV